MLQPPTTSILNPEDEKKKPYQPVQLKDVSVYSPPDVKELGRQLLIEGGGREINKALDQELKVFPNLLQKTFTDSAMFTMEQEESKSLIAEKNYAREFRDRIGVESIDEEMDAHARASGYKTRGKIYFGSDNMLHQGFMGHHEASDAASMYSGNFELMSTPQNIRRRKIQMMGSNQLLEKSLAWTPEMQKTFTLSKKDQREYNYTLDTSNNIGRLAGIGDSTEHTIQALPVLDAAVTLIKGLTPEEMFLQKEDEGFDGAFFVDQIRTMDPEFTAFLESEGVNFEALSQAKNPFHFRWIINSKVQGNAIGSSLAASASYHNFGTEALLFAYQQLHGTLTSGDMVGQVVLTVATGGVGGVVAGAATVLNGVKQVNRVKGAIEAGRTALRLAKAGQAVRSARDWIPANIPSTLLKMASPDGKTAPGVKAWILGQSVEGFVEEGITDVFNQFHEGVIGTRLHYDAAQVWNAAWMGALAEPALGGVLAGTTIPINAITSYTGKVAYNAGGKTFAKMLHLDSSRFREFSIYLTEFLGDTSHLSPEDQQLRISYITAGLVSEAALNQASGGSFGKIEDPKNQELMGKIVALLHDESTLGNQNDAVVLLSMLSLNVNRIQEELKTLHGAGKVTLESETDEAGVETKYIKIEGNVDIRKIPLTAGTEAVFTIQDGNLVFTRDGLEVMLIAMAVDARSSSETVGDNITNALAHVALSRVTEHVKKENPHLDKAELTPEEETELEDKILAITSVPNHPVYEDIIEKLNAAFEVIQRLDLDPREDSESTVDIHVDAEVTRKLTVSQQLLERHLTPDDAEAAADEAGVHARESREVYEAEAGTRQANQDKLNADETVKHAKAMSKKREDDAAVRRKRSDARLEKIRVIGRGIAAGAEVAQNVVTRTLEATARGLEIESNLEVEAQLRTAELIGDGIELAKNKAAQTKAVVVARTQQLTDAIKATELAQEVQLGMERARRDDPQSPESVAAYKADVERVRLEEREARRLLAEAEAENAIADKEVGRLSLLLGEVQRRTAEAASQVKDAAVEITKGIIDIQVEKAEEIAEAVAAAADVAKASMEKAAEIAKNSKDATVKLAAQIAEAAAAAAAVKAAELAVVLAQARATATANDPAATEAHEKFKADLKAALDYLRDTKQVAADLKATAKAAIDAFSEGGQEAAAKAAEIATSVVTTFGAAKAEVSDELRLMGAEISQDLGEADFTASRAATEVARTVIRAGVSTRNKAAQAVLTSPVTATAVGVADAAIETAQEGVKDVASTAKSGVSAVTGAVLSSPITEAAAGAADAVGEVFSGIGEMSGMVVGEIDRQIDLATGALLGAPAAAPGAVVGAATAVVDTTEQVVNAVTAPARRAISSIGHTLRGASTATAAELVEHAIAIDVRLGVAADAIESAMSARREATAVRLREDASNRAIMAGVAATEVAAQSAQASVKASKVEADTANETIAKAEEVVNGVNTSHDKAIIRLAEAEKNDAFAKEAVEKATADLAKARDTGDPAVVQFAEKALEKANLAAVKTALIVNEIKRTVSYMAAKLLKVRHAANLVKATAQVALDCHTVAQEALAEAQEAVKTATIARDTLILKKKAAKEAKAAAKLSKKEALKAAKAALEEAKNKPVTPETVVETAAAEAAVASAEVESVLAEADPSTETDAEEVAIAKAVDAAATASDKAASSAAVATDVRADGEGITETARKSTENLEEDATRVAKDPEVDPFLPHAAIKTVMDEAKAKPVDVNTRPLTEKLRKRLDPSIPLHTVLEARAVLEAGWSGLNLRPDGDQAKGDTLPTAVIKFAESSVPFSVQVGTSIKSSALQAVSTESLQRSLSQANDIAGTTEVAVRVVTLGVDGKNKPVFSLGGILTTKAQIEAEIASRSGATGTPSTTTTASSGMSIAEIEAGIDSLRPELQIGLDNELDC